jgi:hypothetical protein
MAEEFKLPDWAESCSDEFKAIGGWYEDITHNKTSKFIHEAKGYSIKCKIVLHTSFLSWCGYVYIPKEHPLYECKCCKRGYDFMDKFRDIVNWGITYHSGRCIGFDNGHMGQFMPGMNYDRKLSDISDERKFATFEQTKAQTIALADKIIDMIIEQNNKVCGSMTTAEAGTVE